MCSCKSVMDVCTLEYWELVPQGIHRLAAVWVDVDERGGAGGRPRREGGRPGRGACDAARAMTFSTLCFLSRPRSRSLSPRLCVFVATPMRKTL